MRDRGGDGRGGGGKGIGGGGGWPRRRMEEKVIFSQTAGGTRSLTDCGRSVAVVAICMDRGSKDWAGGGGGGEEVTAVPCARISERGSPHYSQYLLIAASQPVLVLSNAGWSTTPSELCCIHSPLIYLSDTVITTKTDVRPAT